MEDFYEGNLLKFSRILIGEIKSPLFAILHRELIHIEVIHIKLICYYAITWENCFLKYKVAEI